MRIFYFLGLGVLLWCAVSCVDKTYNTNDLNNINTDINFGGDHFALPVGNFAPILLDDFLQAGDLLKMTADGRYQFSYDGMESAVIEPLSSMSFNVDLEPMAGISANLSLIKDIIAPDIKINQAAYVTVSPKPDGYREVIFSVNNLKSGINIKYEYTEEILRVNSVSFGAPNSPGERLEVLITPDYGKELTGAWATVNDFNITFPYGFELAADQNDPYQGSISVDKKTYTVSGKRLVADKKMTFYVKKVVFDPAEDQKEKGVLHYNQQLSYSGTFTFVGNFPNKEVEIGVAFFEDKKLSIQDGNFDTSFFKADMDKEETPVKVCQPLEDQSILNIRRVTFAQPTAIQLELDMVGLPSVCTRLKLENYTIEFPEFLVFEDPEINTSKKLVLNDYINNGEKLEKTIYVTGFKFNTNPIKEGQIKIEEQIISSGGIMLDQTVNGLKSSDIGTLVLKPNIVINEMKVKEIEALFRPNLTIKPIEFKVELDPEMDFMRQSVIDLERIAMQVDIENPTGMVANISLHLIPYDQNDQEITEHKVIQTTGLKVQPNTTSKLWLSNSETGMPEGFTFVENDNMETLFRILPSRVEAVLEILPDDQMSVIDLDQEKAAINLNYALMAPIVMGADFELLYKERVTGLKEQLSSFLEYAKTLELSIAAQNKIPLELLIKATALDTSGNPIDVSIDIQGSIAAGTKTGEYTSSSIVLSIKENESGALSLLDQIDLFFSGSAAESGAELKEGQSLSLKMNAKIPGGLNIKPKQ